MTPDVPSPAGLAAAVRARLPDASLDRPAAARATLASVLTVIALVAAQTALGAAVTGGHQPMAEVDAVPTDPDAARWADAPSRTASLSKQRMAPPYGGGSVDEVDVAAVTNDTHVAVRLTWTDPTNDSSLAAPEQYSDAVAVMLRGGDSPPITMGAAGKPVNIWYWRSSWQFGEKRGGAWAGDMYAYPHPDEETRPGAMADNPLSRARYDEFGQNYYAKGYGSLSHAPTQPVSAHGERTEDGWSVVFVRERAASGEYGAAFDEHDTMYLAFAVWNGSTDDVNGEKSITLRFSTLDTRSGDLAQAAVGGGDDGGSDGGDGDAGTSTGGGSSGPMTELLFDYLGPMLAAVVVSWLVAYRRIRS